MKGLSLIVAATLLATVALSLSFPATAAEPGPSSAIANYAENAKTPEDHEAIAHHFDTQAAKARAAAASFDLHDCEHAKSTELQRSGARFPGVAAKRSCRAQLRYYRAQERENDARANHHRRIAEAWRAVGTR
ncbi:MAG TPA: hypothetical protein VFB33_00430 [Candidatus Binataceae bacterium]|nr:hypothetical protein [Candidatus Binataceae bacterium]